MKNSIRIFFIALVAGGSFSALGLAAKEMRSVEFFDSVYGPLPELESKNYIFENLHRPYDVSLPYKRIQELTKEEFRTVIINSFESRIQKRVAKHVDVALDVSEEYQIDPFWLISVMMVESTFNPKAQSPKNARGLMQVKPETAGDVYKMMRKPFSQEEIAELLFDPDQNIDVGAFYLKKLLQNFRLNYKNATVAYNLGPARLRNLLKQKAIVVDDSTYLKRVKTHYDRMGSSFKNYLDQKTLSIGQTYAFTQQE